MKATSSSNGLDVQKAEPIVIEKPTKGWKSWFDEKLDDAEISKLLMKESKEEIQEKLDTFLRKVTIIKMRLDSAARLKSGYETNVVSMQTQAAPEINTLHKKIKAAKEDIKLSKKHLEATLGKMSEVISGLFDFPAFNRLEICNNQAISISIKKELDWDFNEKCSIPKECFMSRSAEIKKAIAPWVKEQMNMGRIDIDGIVVKHRLRVSANLKKTRERL